MSGLEIIPIAIGAYSAAVSTVSTINALKQNKKGENGSNPQAIAETIMKQHVQGPRTGAQGNAQSFASTNVAWSVSGHGGSAFADCGGSWTEVKRKECKR